MEFGGVAKKIVKHLLETVLVDMKSNSVKEVVVHDLRVRVVLPGEEVSTGAKAKVSKRLGGKLCFPFVSRSLTEKLLVSNHVYDWGYDIA